MYSSSQVLALLLATTLFGTVLGAYLMYRGIRPKSRQQLESQLKESESALKQYQLQMAEHFSHTANLVNNLTQNYRDLHEYLACSAQQLTNLDIQRNLITGGDIKGISGNGTVLNQPLDYAPKKGGVGTLSEDYGLREDRPSKPPSSDAYTEMSS